MATIRNRCGINENWIGRLRRMNKKIPICAIMILTGLSAGGLGAGGLGVARAEDLDVIAVRQAGYALNGGDFAYIRSVVASKGDVKQLEVPAKAIAKWAAVVPTLFPKGTETGHETKALPEIWSDPAGFKKIALALGDAATKLATDAKAGEADAVATDTKLLGDQCAACHKAYRAK
jgi:cytochrome c556